MLGMRQAPAPSAREAQIADMMRWVEDVLAYTAAEAKLFCRCEGARMGPHTLVYKVRLERGKPSTMDGLADAIQANLLARPGSPGLHGHVRVTRDPSVGWQIEIPSPFPITPRPDQLAQATRGLQVALAIDQEFEPILLDLGATPAVMFIGPTGSGKTTAAQSALFALLARNSATDLALVVLAEKRLRWAGFTATPHALAAAHTDEDINQLLDNLVAKMNRRLETGAQRPAILTVVDDAHNKFAGPCGKAIAKNLERLVSTGREAGMFTWILTQDAGSNTTSGGDLLFANCRGKVLFKMTNRQASARAAGMGGVGLEALSNHPGDCIVDIDGIKRRGATAYDPQLQAKLPRRAEPVVAVPLDDPDDMWQPRRQRRPAFSTLLEPPAPVLTPAPPPPPTPPQALHEGGYLAPVSTLAPTPAPTPPATPPDAAWPICEARPLTPEEAQEARRRYDNGRGASLNKMCEMVYGPKNTRKLELLRDALGIPQPRLKIIGGDQ